MLRTTANTTSAPVDVTWIIDPDHYAAGHDHVDGDCETRTVTLAPGASLTRNADQDNAADIDAALAAAGLDP